MRVTSDEEEHMSRIAEIKTYPVAQAIAAGGTGSEAA
jgi:hypothetical protein